MSKKFSYPGAHTVDTVDDYHGTAVADPYRWMEDMDAPETQAFVKAQNTLSRGFLDAIPQREKIKARMTELWDFPYWSAPSKHGDRFVYAKNDGLQNQPALYVTDDLDGEADILIDPNALSEDGTVALMGTQFTEDGRLMAYMLSSSGSDWQEVRIRDMESDQDVDDVLTGVKFVSVAWAPDNSGFYYNRNMELGELPPEQTPRFNKIFYHQLGTDQSADIFVFDGDDIDGQIGAEAKITKDGQYLLVSSSRTFSHNCWYFRLLDSDDEFKPLIDADEGFSALIGNKGSTFYFQTDYQTPRGRVVAIDSAHPAPENWQELVPESEDVLCAYLDSGEYLSLAGDVFPVVTMHNAHHQLTLYNLDGIPVGSVELPTLGSIISMPVDRPDDALYFEFHSFLIPATVYRYDMASQQLTVQFGPDPVLDPNDYVVKQVFYPSKDGTQIPMFITHKKDVELDSSNPTFLYGYGGFNISLTPSFNRTRLVWLENGGVFAVANLRGGSEFGEEWHQAGMFGNKQNVFDDFIAAAEYLIKSGYTESEKLAIAGGSNGGLLVATCMLQRPDLYGAVICQVPVTDMLRYQHFTAGVFWTTEYGDAGKDPEAFNYLYAYSPLHNVREGVSYPPTLIATAETDDRVVPMHAEKFAATLQAADAGDNPLLLFIETKAGHGAGKPTTKIIDSFSDIYGFLFNQFNMTVKH